MPPLRVYSRGWALPPPSAAWIDRGPGHKTPQQAVSLPRARRSNSKTSMPASSPKQPSASPWPSGNTFANTRPPTTRSPTSPTPNCSPEPKPSLAKTATATARPSPPQNPQKANPPHSSASHVSTAIIARSHGKPRATSKTSGNSNRTSANSEPPCRPSPATAVRRRRKNAKPNSSPCPDPNLHANDAGPKRPDPRFHNRDRATQTPHRRNRIASARHTLQGTRSPRPATATSSPPRPTLVSATPT